jgi:hypothetical protein
VYLNAGVVFFGWVISRRKSRSSEVTVCLQYSFLRIHKGLIIDHLHVFVGKVSSVVQGTAEDLNANLSDDDDDESITPPVERATEKRSEGRKSLAQGEVTETVKDREEQTLSIIKELEDGRTMR